MKNSRTTFGGKGDTFRSDFSAYQAGPLWKHEWTPDVPIKEGYYQVKYYDENNKLIYDEFYCFYDYDYNGLPYMSVGADCLFTFCNDKVGLKWKFKKDI